MNEPSVKEGLVVGGDFRILTELGAGGMGAVYRAEQLSTGKLRAVKIMHARFSDDPVQRARFTQEARVAASVASAHVVEIIAAGVAEDSGIPWIAMELLEGEDLTTHVKRLGPLSLGAVSQILEQLCHGLGEAHDGGIVHRDLKPHNVFITESHNTHADRMVKVLDFGIAKLIAESTMSTTAALGSPAWMAPEQTEASPLISPAADVWPLGLVTFWLLTARPFWRAANHRDGSLQAVLREMVIESIPSGSARAGELGCRASWPPLLDGWLARCLERDPLQRFANAREAHRAFVAVLDGKELEPLDSAATRRPRAVLADAAATTRPASTALAERQGDDDESPNPAATTSASRSGPPSVPPTSIATQVTVTRVSTPALAQAREAESLEPSQEIDRTASPLTRRKAAPPARRVGSWVLGAALLVGAGVWAGSISRNASSPEAAAAKAFEGPVDPIQLDDTPSAAPGDTTPREVSPTANSSDATAAASSAPAASSSAASSSSASSSSASSSAASSSAPPVPVVPARRSRLAPSHDDELPPFDSNLALTKIRTAQSHAAGACARLDGPRAFGANLVFSPYGSLAIKGSFTGATGACVRSTLGMARMGPFGPANATPQSLAATVTLPPAE